MKSSRSRVEFKSSSSSSSSSSSTPNIPIHSLVFWQTPALTIALCPYLNSLEQFHFGHTNKTNYSIIGTFWANQENEQVSKAQKKVKICPPAPRR